MSRTSQLTINESDSEYLQNVASEDNATEAPPGLEKSETLEDINILDISECSVAEKAHYFEEQIQKEMTRIPSKLQQQESLKSDKEKPVKTKVIERETTDKEEKHLTESRQAEKSVDQKRDMKEEHDKDHGMKGTKKLVVEDEKEKDDGKEIDTVSSKSVMDVREEPSNTETEPDKGTIEDSEAKETLEDIIKERKDRSGKVKEFIEDVLTEEMMELPVDAGRSTEREKTQETIDSGKMQPTIETVEARADVQGTVKDMGKKGKELKEFTTDMNIDQRVETVKSMMGGVIQENTSGTQVVTEKTTVTYKVEKDGTMVEEVVKSVKITGKNGTTLAQTSESSAEMKTFKTPLPHDEYESQFVADLKVEAVPLVDIKTDVQQSSEEERKSRKEDIKLDTPAPKEKQIKTEEGVSKSLPKVDEFTKVVEAKQVKKEFESRIPISMTKADKDKAQKELKLKTSSETALSLEKPENGKDLSSESPDTSSPVSKKKEFESRIPKRVTDSKLADKAVREDGQPKKGNGSFKVTETKSSEEVTSKSEKHLTTKSETQTFSKSFTDPQEAFKMFEDMNATKKDFATVTSKVDHTTSSTLQKKETVSSEISTGKDKIITHEEKERIEKKKSTETKMKKETPAETLEQKKSKHEEVDKTAVQKMSMNLSDDQEIIDASASESISESKKEQSIKMLEDREGLTTRESGTSRVRESEAEVAIRIKQDASDKPDAKYDSKTVEDIGERVSKAIVDADKIEMIAQGESHKESRESFDETQFVPSQKKPDTVSEGKKDVEPEITGTWTSPASQTLEERQQQKFKEIEARTIAESLIQSIESEIEKRADANLKAELLSKGYLEQAMTDGFELDDEKLADNLTRQFESIMKKSADDEIVKGSVNRGETQQSKFRSSLHEEYLEKGSTRDSISISDDLTKDEESSPNDKEESFPLSSSQARFQDRDITMSPSSMSEQIDFEETIDVDTNELENLSKPTLSPPSEKQRSTRSSGQADLLQTDFQTSASLPHDKILSEISGARVLEILEPGADSQSRQDSVDVPSLEMDEYRVSEQTSKGISSLHESVEGESSGRVAQERDKTISRSTVSEDTNIDYSLVHEQPPPLTIQKECETGTKGPGSLEIQSPLVSPRLKAPSLEITPVDWMIGDEKIEISETLQPSQVFIQELEAYESSIRQQSGLPSQDPSVDLDQESVTKSSEDTSVIESVKETVAGDSQSATSVGGGTKFTVIPVSERDFESELVENKLDISCQELVDTLQREYDAKTPTEDIASARDEMTRQQMIELEKHVTENITPEEDDFLTKRQETSDESTDIIIAQSTNLDTENLTGELSSTVNKETVPVTESAEVNEKRSKAVEEISKMEIDLKLENTAKPLTEPTQETTETDSSKNVRVDDVLKEWTEGYLAKMKPSSEEYKRHMEKTLDKHDKPGRSAAVPSDTCAFKIKKDDLTSVDLSARYAITVLDQVVKKEIAEVKESLEAAKQDLIEELSENSEIAIQIKDSPSEFQFKLQPESIPNDLPFLYRPPSPEHVHIEPQLTETETSTVMPETLEPSDLQVRHAIESRIDVEESTCNIIDDPSTKTMEEMPVAEKSEIETIIAVHEDKDDEEGRSSPMPFSRSGSDIDNKDESSSLAPPPRVMRRRHKPARSSKRVTSESEADIGSSSGDSSNYQSCDYGSGSRPSSSDIEALQSGGVPSATASEYETAMMSVEASASRPTSQEYHTAATTLSSRESMKSLNSLSSGHLGSIDSTSELSETLVPSEPDVDREEIEENLDHAFDQERPEQTDSSGSDIPIDEDTDKLDGNVPSRMKRSSEMIFPQIIDDNGVVVAESAEAAIATDSKGIDSATSAFTMTPGALQSVDIMTSRVSEDGVQSVCTQVISTQVTAGPESPVGKSESTISALETNDNDMETETETMMDVQTTEADSLEPKSSASGIASDSPELTLQTSTLSMMQQASMSTSSTSGMSIDTVIEKEKSDRHSPDSDSFELVDKPDITDDFVVIEEVGREAEEYDSEGKSIRISSIPQVTSKNYDRDLENLIAENKDDPQESTSQTTKNNELFDFESEESPPQASNEDQYSQSYSDEEQYEGSKKWMEMQFQSDARAYDIEYDRGPLEDIKEEEVTDFEAGSSRFGSLGSHKESIGSVGSMRGSFGSTPDYDVLAGKKYFTRPADHDNVSLSSLQEFEHLESTVAAENARRAQCGSQDSTNNGSLPRRYATSRSGHGDDISLSSLKDFEGLEKACREAHLIELRAREEEDLLEHESPENKYKLENLPRTRAESSVAGSFNPSTSGSDDYEKRIKEIDEIIRIAQSNVEKFDRQDDTTEDISQIEITDAEKMAIHVSTQQSVPEQEEPEDIPPQRETNVMETSTDSLELEENMDKKQHPLYRSSDSLEMKTTLDFPSLSSDSLNNVKDAKEAQSDITGPGSDARRISSDSLDMPLLEQPQEVKVQDRSSESSNHHSGRVPPDNSVEQTSSTETNVKNGETKTMSSADT